ncbi:MAG: hypothetical protein ABWX67_00640 [Allosphingosinicella sp.]
MKRNIIHSLFGTGPKRKRGAADLKIVHADSNDPDTIAVEAWDGGEIVFEMVTDCQGARTLWVGGREFDRDEFLALLNRCAEKLDSWDAELRETGAAWDNEEERAP